MKKILTPDERLEQLIVRGLLRLWSRHPGRQEILLEARRPYEGPNKRLKWEYKCAVCFNYFKGGRGGDIEVDHIIPKGTYKGQLWEWAARLFCEKKNLQVLCKTCHYKKSALEGEARREIRRKIKKPVVKAPRMRKRKNG